MISLMRLRHMYAVFFAAVLSCGGAAWAQLKPESLWESGSVPFDGGRGNGVAPGPVYAGDPTQTSQVALAENGRHPGAKPRDIPAPNFYSDLENLEYLESAQGPDFSTIPPAHTVEEANQRFNERAAVVVNFWRARPIGKFNEGGAFYGPAIARAATGAGLDEINRAILDPATHVDAAVGSDFRELGPLCRRNGDYDFMLQGLVNLAYVMKRIPGGLSPAAQAKLYHELLNQSGAEHHTRFSLFLCGTHRETENHILMTETSRYLTNQLLLEEARSRGLDGTQYDNASNGFDEWMLATLKPLLQRDFEEFNSRPYQGYSVHALENLYNYAQSPRVKLAARNVLDYLAARFATQANGLLRQAPIRRQEGYTKLDEIPAGDHETWRYALLAGNYDFFSRLERPYQPVSGTLTMLTASIGTYRVPDSILDLLIRQDHNTYFQRYRHAGVELYYASPRFKISAGGVFVRFGLDLGVINIDVPVMDGWAFPTTIIPSIEPTTKRSELIRIEGHADPKKRSNLCVAPGFACGLNVVVPADLPDGCRQREGPWTFVDFTSPVCPRRHGFFAAVYSAPCDGKLCSAAAKNFGFVEAHDPREGETFADFTKGVLGRNGASAYGSEKENLYVTTAGDSIGFVPVRENPLEWGITRINGVPQQTDIRKWPLADGPVIRAKGDGRVEIDNPYLHRSVILDQSRTGEPARSESDF